MSTEMFEKCLLKFALSISISVCIMFLATLITTRYLNSEIVYVATLIIVLITTVLMIPSIIFMINYYNKLVGMFKNNEDKQENEIRH